MPLPGDNLEIGLQFKADDKAIKGATQGVKELDRNLKQAGTTAAAASNTIGGQLGSSLTSLAGKLGGVTLALLGANKILRTMGRAEGFQEFKAQFNAATEAVGNLISKSDAFQKTFGLLGDFLGKFAQAINPEKSGLIKWAESLDKAARRAGDLAGPFKAMNDALEENNRLFKENEERIDNATEAEIKRLEAARDRDLALAETDDDPVRRASRRASITGQSAQAITTFRNQRTAEKSARNQAQAALNLAGGPVGTGGPDPAFLSAAGTRLDELRAELGAANSEALNKIRPGESEQVTLAELILNPRAAGAKVARNQTRGPADEAGANAALARSRDIRDRINKLQAQLPPGVFDSASAQAYLAKTSDFRSTSALSAREFSGNAAALNQSLALSAPTDSIQRETLAIQGQASIGQAIDSAAKKVAADIKSAGNDSVAAITLLGETIRAEQKRLESAIREQIRKQ